MKRDPDLVRLLVECSVYYQRELTEQVLDVYLDDLDGISFAAIQHAIQAHRADPDRGRFWPLIADIRGKLPPAYQHPSSDIAWAVVLRSMDEGASVVLTEEMLQAKAVAQSVWDSGDQIGARMSFKSAYDRLVLNSGTRKPRWQLSVGHRADEREAAVQAALAQGLIGEGTARQLAPALPPATSSMRLLAGNVVQGNFGQVSSGLEAVRRLRSIVDASIAESDRRRDSDREQHQAQEQARREELMQQYEKLISGAPHIPLPEPPGSPQRRPQGGTR